MLRGSVLTDKLQELLAEKLLPGEAGMDFQFLRDGVEKPQQKPLEETVLLHVPELGPVVSAEDLVRSLGYSCRQPGSQQRKSARTYPETFSPEQQKTAEAIMEAIGKCPGTSLHEIALCLQTLTDQLKKQILSLREGANEREVMLNALSEAILLIDEEENVVRWNETAKNLFYPDRNGNEQEILECPAELRDCLGKIGSTVYTEKRTLERCGRTFQLLVKAVSFTRGERRFFLISATDLTDLSKLEASHREFIAAISHEMKTPLTGIVGAVDAIGNGALDNEEYKKRCIDTLTTQSERLHTLLLNFLTLTSLENVSHKTESDFLPVQPLAVLRGAMEVCRPAAEAAGIELTIIFCDSDELLGDSQLLLQALNNLITNAIIHSGTKRIELSARRTGTRIDFCVRDYGCGIPEEHRERIFKRFYRVPSTGKKQSGSGIGLAIVKHIALHHHGTVSVVSADRAGSEFHLILPRGLD